MSTGPGRPVLAMWNASRNVSRQLVSGLQKVAVLHHRHGDAHDIGFLERVRADDAARHLARDHHERHAVHVGRRNARHRVRGARAAGDDDHAHVARGARVAVGLVHGALFVARQHVLDLVRVVQRVVYFDGLAAGIAEHEVDALGFERGHHGLGALHRLALLRRLAAQPRGAPASVAFAWFGRGARPSVAVLRAFVMIRTPPCLPTRRASRTSRARRGRVSAPAAARRRDGVPTRRRPRPA